MGIQAIIGAKRSLLLHFHLVVRHPSVPEQGESEVTAGYDVLDENALA